MFCLPKPDADGQVRADPRRGGKRRIDRIIFDPMIRSKITGFNFLTCLAGLTDHVPIALSVETDFNGP
jgi:sphingomyelin phosphodiesterase 3